jgi:hypothetical protein
MNSRAAAQDVYRSLTANPSMATVIVDGEPHSIRLGWLVFTIIITIIIIIIIIITTGPGQTQLCILVI